MAVKLPTKAGKKGGRGSRARRSCGFTQSRKPDPESASSIPQTKPLSGKNGVRFIWVPNPDGPDIAKEPDLAVHASNLSKRFLAQYPMYNDENLSMIKAALGKGFANRASVEGSPSSEERVVHQGVATMQHLRNCFTRDVHFQSWDWLVNQLRIASENRSILRSDIARDQHIRTMTTRRAHRLRSRKISQSLVQQHQIFQPEANIPYIIFLYSDEPYPPTADIYSAMAKQQALRSSLFRCFPSQSEHIFQASKLGDCQALDEVAATSPQKYAYRPRACFKHGEARHSMKDCCLAGLNQIVMKRSHSSAGEHVLVIDGDRAEPNQRNNRNLGYCWFGQEFEPSFSLFGEFRVFIVAESDREGEETKSIRGRRGTILHTIITEWPQGNDVPGEVYAHAANPYDFRSPYVQPLEMTDLHDFALHVYESLRGRSDWETHFETLEVGVRLDIGISTERKKGRGEKMFFVNEITRFYDASYFSQQTLGAPHQEVCYAFAEAINAYFPKGTG